VVSFIFHIDQENSWSLQTVSAGAKQAGRRQSDRASYCGKPYWTVRKRIVTPLERCAATVERQPDLLSDSRLRKDKFQYVYAEIHSQFRRRSFLMSVLVVALTLP
jgi:hypothetical protein